MQPQLTQPQWLALTPFQRNELKRLFNIPRSEGAHVQDNTVISDGHTHRDLATLTLEKLQQHLRSKSDDFYALLDQTIAGIKEPPPPPPEEPNHTVTFQINNGDTTSIVTVPLVTTQGLKERVKKAVTKKPKKK